MIEYTDGITSGITDNIYGQNHQGNISPMKYTDKIIIGKDQLKYSIDDFIDVYNSKGITDGIKIIDESFTDIRFSVYVIVRKNIINGNYMKSSINNYIGKTLIDNFYSIADIRFSVYVIVRKNIINGNYMKSSINNYIGKTIFYGRCGITIGNLSNIYN